MELERQVQAPRSDASDNPRFHWGLISKYRGQLFGFSILWIMLMHSKEYTPLPKNPYLSRYLLYDSWIRLGGTGVDVFLILSGIGLCFALRNRPGLGRFYGKRLKRILIPYLVIAALYWWLRHYVIMRTPELFWQNLSLVSFFTRGVITFWYIALILPLYLAAPLLIALFQTRLRAPILALCFGLFVALNCLSAARAPTFYGFTEIALSRIFSFVLGCYLGKTVYEERPLSRLWVLFGILTLSCQELVPFVVKHNLPGMPVKLAKHIWGCAAALTLCIFLPILLELLRAERLNRFLGYLGSISLELYLSHVALKNLVKMLNPDWESWSAWKCMAVYGGAVMLGSFLFSALFHLLQTRIEGAVAAGITRGISQQADGSD